MDMNNLKLFKSLKANMDWLGERQRLLAQNVANADTPDYKALDLKELDFRKVLESSRDVGTPLALSSSQGGGMQGTATRTSYALDRHKKIFEVQPTGNGVTLEEQMLRLSDNNDHYKISTQLYKKYTNMLQMAVKGPGG